jgi:aspartyl-tRNA(Asn)/glutamyl-tRNA(Gln) amidotransferase subunit A
LARTSADAALLLDAMLGKSTISRSALELQGLRLGILDAHREGAEMEAAVVETFDAACYALEQAGAVLVPITIADLSFADSVLLAVIAPEAAVVHAKWLAEQPDAYAPLTRQQIELGFAVPTLVHLRAQQYRRHLTQQFLHAFDGVDAILSPTAPWVAPAEDPAVVGDEGMAEARRTAPYNLTGLPALTINIGYDPAGLPIGLQIATPPQRDDLCLAIGVAVEALLG